MAGMYIPCLPLHSVTMRAAPLLALALAVAVLYAAPAAASASCAVDLGSEFLKVALIKPGKTPIAVVVNEMSRRKSPALVGVANGGQRLLGEEALSLGVRHPDSIFTRVRELLGRPADDAGLQAMLRDYSLPFTLVPHGSRGTAALQARDGTRLSAEEAVVRAACVGSCVQACGRAGARAWNEAGWQLGVAHESASVLAGARIGEGS